jgi:peptidylprolyl isomerase
MLRFRNHPNLYARFCLTVVLFAVANTPALAQQELVWNPLPQDRTVYLELEEGIVVIELNPAFAPKTIEHLKTLMEDQYYRGASFYRVIDGFMAQAGLESEVVDEDGQETLKAEFEINWPLEPEEQEDAAEEAEDWVEMSWTPVQENDLYAPYTGFVDGFAVGRDQKKEGKAWLLHCPGTIAMARSTEPDSAYADFYIVMGQAPRYLDRNMTIFGRVVWGMDVVQRIKRGPPLENGIIVGDLDRSWIKRLRMASSLDQNQQLDIWIADTNDKSFEKMLKERRQRKNEFFSYPPPKVLDICQVPVPARLEKPDKEPLLKN